MTSKRKIIIDCDAGSDDAFGLMVALGQPDVDILAITCGGGNVSLENVAVNVMKVLEVCNRTDIPVHKGASTPLMGQSVPDSSFLFGEDGFGDVPDIPEPDMTRVKDEHSVNAILRLAREHPGQITLVALAPLTNVALACRMDPELPKNLKNVVIMGGNDKGCPAEFNFSTDVQAASICLNEISCPLTVVTWEACVRHSFTWEFYEQLTSQGTAKSEFFRKIDAKSVEYYKNEGNEEYTSCDMFAMVVAVRPEVIEKDTKAHAEVEPFGTNGQMIYKFRHRNVTLVKQCNEEKYKKIAVNALN